MSDDPLLERYLAHVATQRSAETARLARIHLRGFRRHLDGRGLSLLQAPSQAFQDFVDGRLAAGAALKGVSSQYSHIRRFYGWCVGEGLIAVNPAAGVQVPAGTSTRTLPTPDEVERLFACAEQEVAAKAGLVKPNRLALRMKLWLHLMVEAAAWPSEIAPLHLDDLDEAKRAVRLGRGTARDRVRPLSPDAWATLMRLREATASRIASRGGYLFPAETVQTKGPVSGGQVTAAFATLCRAAGLHATITPVSLSRVVVRELHGAVPESVSREALARKMLGAAAMPEPTMDVQELRQALERWHPFGRPQGTTTERLATGSG